MKGSEMANALADFVNGAGLKVKKDFVDEMLRQHRTLQQESFDLMFQTMEAWANIPENLYDARNKFAVEASQKITKLFNSPLDSIKQNIRFTLDAEIKIGTTFSTEIDSVDGIKFQWWEFTKIDLIRVQDFNGEKNIVVDGRAKRI